MEDHRYDALVMRSQAVHRQKHVMPAAAWLLEQKSKTVKTPEIVRGLDGRLQSGEVLTAMARLGKIGAIGELPHLGQPNPKHFEIRRSHPFWDFVEATAAEVDDELDRAPGSERASD